MKKHLISGIYVLAIGFLYLTTSLYISNYDLINATLFRPYPPSYKAKIFTAVYMSLFYTFNTFQLAMLILTALLTGINLVLISNQINKMKTYGKLKAIIGGSTILGLATTGCAACGLPLFAFLGIGGSIALLPLKGYEFSLLAITLLLLSILIIKRNSAIDLACKVIPRKKNKR